MSTETNPLRWPSTDNAVSRLFQETVGLLEQKDVAAELQQLLQAAESSNIPATLSSASCSPRLETLKRALEKARKSVFELEVSNATYKLDGTNVGLDASGCVYGRNTVVDAAADVYMKTPLAFVRSFSEEAAAVQACVAECTGQKIEKLVLVGELVRTDAANLNIYDYEHAGFRQENWRVFGALARAEFENRQAFVETKKILHARGFSVLSEEQNTKEEFENNNAEFAKSQILRVAVDARFREMFPRLPYVPFLMDKFQAANCINEDRKMSFAKLVLEHPAAHEIVATGRQEGLVLLMAGAEAEREQKESSTCSSTELWKWKGGQEAAGGTVNMLWTFEKFLKQHSSVSAEAAAQRLNEVNSPSVEDKDAERNLNMSPLLASVFTEEECVQLKSVVERLLKVYENDERVDLNADGSVREAKKKKAKANKRKPGAPHPSKASYNIE